MISAILGMGTTPCPCERLQPRLELKRILSNVTWLTWEKLVKLGVGFWVTVLTARYLAPEQYGELQFALAFIGMFAIFAACGTDRIVLRELAANQDGAREILGSALAIKLTGGVLVAVLSVLIAVQIPANKAITCWMIGIMSLNLVFSAFDVLDFSFQTHLKAHLSVRARLEAFLFGAISRLVLIQCGAPLLAFAILIVIETGLEALFYWLLFARDACAMRSWTASWSTVIGLLSESWPFLVSGTALLIFAQADRIFVGTLASKAELGIYAVYLQLSRLPVFAIASLGTSINPRLVQACKTESLKSFMMLVRRASSIASWMSFWLAAAILLLGHWLVVTFFGAEYSGHPLLMPLLAGCLFLNGSAMLTPNYFVIMRQTRTMLAINIVSLCVNIALNLLLIPRFRAVGAALAQLFTLAFSNYVSVLLLKHTRDFGKTLLAAMLKGLAQQPAFDFLKRGL